MAGTAEPAFLGEIVSMAFDTLRTSKMRSALTVLGVVIGITSIVGMTSLIRGFDNSLRESISQLGPDTIIVQKWGALSLAAGKSFLEVARRPNLTMEDARAIQRECPSVALVDVWLGAFGNARSRIFYGTRTHQTAADLRRHRELGGGELRQGRGRAACSSRRKSSTGATSCCSATDPGRRSSPASIRSARRSASAANQFTVIGVLGKRPSPGDFSTDVDDFAVIPYGTHEKLYGKVLKGSAKISAGNFNPAVFRTAMIAVVPRVGMRAAAMQEVEGHPAHPPPAEARRAERLRPRNAGRRPQRVGTDQPGDLPRARRHLLDRADGRRHRRDGDHDDLGDRTDPRDRRPQGARCPPPRDPLAVPDRSDLPDLGRRRARHLLRQLDRPDRPLGSPASRCRCPGGPSPSASASPPASGSSSGCSRRSKRRGWIRSRRCDTSRLGDC